MFRPALFLSLILGTSLRAYAQEFRWDLEWYNSAQGYERTSDNVLDTSGRRLRTPESRLESDLRLNTKYTSSGGTRLVIRPRVVGNLNQYRYTDTDEIEITTKADASLPEAYLEGDPTKELTLAAGLQNYQWGPAEFFSPSNPFYHFRQGQRSFTYKEDGRFLLRANLNPSANLNFVAIAEPLNNGQSYWIYDQDFKPKGLMKAEFRGENSLNYISLGAGTGEDSLPFVSEYFNFEVFSGFSVYFDGKQSKGSAHYVVEVARDTLYDMVYFKNEIDWQSLYVAGFRWEGRLDFRMEYIYNSFGLDKESMAAAFQSALPQHPRGQENLRRLLKSGSELVGQHYSYASLRIPDLFIESNNLSLRYIQSLMDQSASVQIAWDSALGDAWTLFAEANLSIGDNTQELSALEKASGQLGFKWNL